MRIIDFRAWDKKKSEIVDVMDIDFSGNKVGVCNVPKRLFKDGRLHTIHSIERDWSEVELMQSTGLKDKNGTEIFEGDIIKLIGTYKDSKGKELGRYMVEWNNYYTGFYPLIDDPLEGGGTEYEVIGNIYENPEL